MADVEGEKIDNMARLEALKQQENLIKEEKEELQKEDIKAVSCTIHIDYCCVQVCTYDEL